MKIEKFRLIGITLENKTTNENNQSGIDCGTLWARFEKEQIFNQIPNKIGNELYAVYHDYEGDETKPFAYFIGAKVSKDVTVPEGLSELNVPAQEYEKTLAKGAMPNCIGEAWKKIWASKTPRKFGFDFEVYDERSHDWTNAEVDIFLSV